MKVEQEFLVARPLPVVWDFFKDIPRVAACMPGARYLGQKPDNGPHLGAVATKVGPFQTNFEGEADVVFDEAAKHIRSIGKGVDKKGASRGKMTILCSLAPEGAASTKVSVEADVQLSGAIAQFGRTNLLTEIAGVMIRSFVANAEAQLAPAASAAAEAPSPEAPLPEAGPISMVGLVLIALRRWLLSLVGRRA